MKKTMTQDEARLWERLENVKSGIGACVLTAAGSRPNGEEAVRAHGQILRLVEDGLRLRQELGLDPVSAPPATIGLEPFRPAPLEVEPVTDEWFRSRRPAPPDPPRHRAQVA